MLFPVNTTTLARYIDVNKIIKKYKKNYNNHILN